MAHNGTTADRFVEVYDEPRHVTCLTNEYTHVYRVQLEPSASTLWHRHQQDTLYFSLNDAQAGEELPGGEAFVTDVPCGAAVSRPHRSEPLIHRVTNRGAQAFHLVGAEALRTPPSVAPPLVAAPGIDVVLTTERFRVARLRLAPETDLPVPGPGLLLVARAATIALPHGTRSCPAGHVAWFGQPATLALPAGFDGFFAQWC